MRRLNKTAILQSLALAWLVVTLTIFLLISQASYVQFFVLPSLPTLAAHLARIAPARYVADLLLALAGATIFSLACLSLGLRILRWLKIPSGSPLAYGTTAFLVGEVLFSLVFLTLLSLERLSPAAAALVLTLGFLLGFSALRSFLRGMQPPQLPEEFRRIDKVMLALVALIFAAGLLLSSARLGYDSVAQYFSNARIMALAGQPLVLSLDYFLVSSLHPSVLFAALIQLFGDQAARVLPWVNGLAILLLALAIAEQAGLSPRARLWFLILMVTTTAFLDLLGDGKVEIIATAPILAAVYWMLLSLDEPSGNVFALIGLLAGYAMVARPNNLFLLGLFMALLYAGHALVRFRSGQLQLKPLIRSGLWILPPLLALAIFHLFQRGIWLTSPVPSIASVPSLKAAGANWQWQFDPANLNWYRLFYPFAITFFNSPQSLGTISPLFLGILPFLLIRNLRQNFRLSSNLPLILFSVIITLALWITLFFTVVEIRYVLFLWVLLYVPIARMFEGAIESGEKRIRVLVSSLLVALLAYMAARTVLIALDTYSPVDRDGQAHCSDVYLCAFLDPLNKTASPGARVFVLNAYRYYLRPDLFACSSRAAEFQALAGLAGQNSSDFWVELYRQGFDFITYEANFAQAYSGFGKLPDPHLAPDWLQIRTISEMSEAGEFVYQIDAVDPPFKPERACAQSTGDTWLVRSTQ